MKKLLFTLAAGSLIAAVFAGPAAASGGVVMPVGVNYTHVSDFDAATGTTAEVVRIYYDTGDGIPTSYIGTPVQTALERDEDVVVSFTPHTSIQPAQLQDFAEWAQSVKKSGYASRVYVDVWHEPQHYFGGTSNTDGGAFEAAYEKFQAKADGLMFGPIFNTYPIYHVDPTTNTTLNINYWMPPAADDSFVGIDTYPGDDPSQTEFYNPLSVISPITNLAHAEGIPVGIAETCVMDTTYTSGTEAEAVQYLEYYENFGGIWLMYFDGPPSSTATACNIINGGKALKDAWDNVYNSHQAPA
jgi:hypothetical protein